MQRAGLRHRKISTGFITIPTGDWLRLVETVRGEGLRSGTWGTKDLFGRVLTYKEGADSEPHSVDH